MELSYMLNQMCHEVLSNADINAIRKERGFTKSETDSRSQFESFYLSSIGLEAAMRKLTLAETACLHLLNHKAQEVALPFFERVYGSAGSGERYYYGTFTQQYQNTFRKVKQNLLRRGLLVMAELRTRADNTKMERWRFHFPREFAPYLPPLIPEPHAFDIPGDDRSIEARRGKVLEALGQPHTKPFWQKGFECTVLGGDFTLGREPFSVKRLTEWQGSAWASALSVTMPNDSGQSLSPVEAVRAILGTLAPGEWADLEQLAAAYDVLCFGVRAPSLREICKMGWERGSLVQHSAANQVYYRLPEMAVPETETVAPDKYLHPLPQRGAVQVDLHSIPFDELETLNILAYLDVDHNQMVAVPSRVKLGRAAPEIRGSALGIWLSSQIPAFGEASELIAKNWGKTILHANLLIARIKDLSLRVQLERGLGENLVLLSDEFVAFPVEARTEVEKIVHKGGFVVKTVTA
jgi:hypothetical protein